jgi:leader peptidase (prepilin peptidase)/N-methyltransferase
MAVFIAALFGAFIGSFLNVCVHRLPRNESVVQPPSRCYSCSARVRWYDNLPVISYLVLRGRCRWCGAGFSPRYLVMEVLVAALTALVAWAVTSGALRPAPWLADLGLPGWMAQAATAGILCAVLWFLVVATLIDLEHLIIPDELTKSFQLAAPLLAMLTTTNTAVGWDAGGWLRSKDIFGTVTEQPGAFLVRVLVVAGAAVALLLLTLPLARWIYSRFCPEGERWSEDDHRGFRAGVLWFAAATVLSGCVLAALVAVGSPVALGAAAALGQGLLGSLAGWWSLYAVGLLGTMAFRRNAMGFGDVKFLAPIGAFLGPVGVLYAFLGAATAGAVVGLPVYLATRRNLIPFGPYLALGSVLALAGGPRLHQWLFAGIFQGM